MEDRLTLGISLESVFWCFFGAKENGDAGIAYFFGSIRLLLSRGNRTYYPEAHTHTNIIHPERT
jgi:hypothetical protein